MAVTCRWFVKVRGGRVLSRAALLLCLLTVFGLTAARPGAAQGNGEREHPYLFFERGERRALRRKFRRPPQSHYLQVLVQEANEAMGRTPSADHNKVADTLQVLLWAYHFTGKKRYRNRTIAWMKQIWNRTSFKEWSEMGTGAMAVAYDTLYPELADQTRKKMKAYLKRALNDHLSSMDSWAYDNPSNTVPTQAGAAGLAALALMWEVPKAKKAVKQTRNRLADFASDAMSPDGGYIEGVFYWDFGVGYYLWFAHALHQTTGNDELIQHPLLKKQHRFVETMIAGDGHFLPFNDAQPQLIGYPVCADLGSRFDHPLMLWLADFMASRMAGKARGPNVEVESRGAFKALAALLRGTKSGPRNFPGVPLVSHLEKMEWGVMRSDRSYVPNLVVGVKGSGGTLSHHKQSDPGSFTFYAGGEMFLLDPGYHKPDATSHTLPLINGKGPGKKGGKIVKASKSRERRVMVLDASRAYGTAKRMRRTIVMLGDRAVVVLDDIVPSGENRIKAQYQAAHETRINRNPTFALINGRKVRVFLWTFGPDLTLKSRKRTFGDSWVFQNMAEDGRITWQTLSGSYRASSDNPLVTVLLPVSRGRKTARPRFENTGDTIRLALPGGSGVEFSKTEDGWTLK